MRYFFLLILSFFSYSTILNAQSEKGKYLFPVQQNGLYGYINYAGDMVIPATFQWGDYFHEGLAAVQKKGKYGFINTKGEWKIQPEYDSVKIFSEGFALTSYMGNDSTFSWQFIDTLGKTLEANQPAICKASNFHDGRAVIMLCGHNDYNYVVIDRSGKKAFVTKDYYIDEDHFPEFHEGYMRVILPDNTRSFIDTNGQLWNKGSFQDVGNFSEGLAWYMENGDYGFINKEGQIVIPAAFSVVSDFSEGLAKTIEKQKLDPIKQIFVGGLVGYIDNKGKYVASPQYEDGGDFHDGFALVKLGGYYGFLNASGSAVINFQYAEAKGFFRGLAFVKNENHWEYINTSGKKVW